MKKLYPLFVLGTCLLFAPNASWSATRPATDTPTEAQRKATREQAAVAKKAAASEKAATKKTASKRTFSRRLHKINAGMHHALLVALGMEESKAVTSPAKLNRQLHLHQKHLRLKARMDAKARRRRSH